MEINFNIQNLMTILWNSTPRGGAEPLKTPKRAGP